MPAYDQVVAPRRGGELHKIARYYRLLYLYPWVREPGLQRWGTVSGHSGTRVV
jgi:hypothetical protein